MQGVVDADCPGPCSRNVALFDYQTIPRPIFPLDRDFTPNFDTHVGNPA